VCVCVCVYVCLTRVSLASVTTVTFAELTELNKTTIRPTVYTLCSKKT